MILCSTVLSYLEYQDMVKMALLSKEMNSYIDPNNALIDTDSNFNISLKKTFGTMTPEIKPYLSYHLAQVFQVQDCYTRASYGAEADHDEALKYNLIPHDDFQRIYGINEYLYLLRDYQLLQQKQLQKYDLIKLLSTKPQLVSNGEEAYRPSERVLDSYTRFGFLDLDKLL